MKCKYCNKKFIPVPTFRCYVYMCPDNDNLKHRLWRWYRFNFTSDGNEYREISKIVRNRHE